MSVPEQSATAATAPVVRRDQALALGAALVTVTLWASAFVGIRAAAPDLAGGQLALARLVVGSVALGAILVARGERLPPRRALPGIALLGLIWFTIYNIALNEAELRVDAGTTAMLVNVGPIFIALGAGALLGEGFPRRLLTGVAIAFAGALTIGLATSSSGAHEPGLGIALCLVAALSYAAAVLIQKPLLAHASGLQITWLACTIGALGCLPFAPSLIGDLADANGEALAWTAYLGIFPTAIAFTTWAYALRRTTAGRMGATTYLVPPLTIVLGLVWLGETQPALTLGGGALCLAGVIVARRG